jgi:phosphohistidine phosphatase
MRIFLVRHLQAQPADEVERDEDREVAGKAEIRLRKACRGLRRLEIYPDRILTSPVKRAVQTAEILAAELGLVEEVEPIEELMPEARPEDMVETLKGIHAEQLMLVGHKPFLGQLASLLMGGGPSAGIGIKKGGLVRLDVEDWDQDPPGRLRWLVTAKQLSWMKKKKKKGRDDGDGAEGENRPQRARIRVGLAPDAGPVETPTGEDQPPSSPAESVKEQIRRALSAMEYATAARLAGELLESAADPKEAEEIGRLRAQAALFDGLAGATPVSHLARAEHVDRLTFQTAEGKKLRITAILVEQAGDHLLIEQAYGSPGRVDTRKNRLLDHATVPHGQWRAEREEELRLLEGGLEDAGPLDRLLTRLTLALFCKTNEIAERGTAFLLQTIADPRFPWLLGTWFPEKEADLHEFWVQAAPEAAAQAAKAPAQPPLAASVSQKDRAAAARRDAPLPAEAAELKRIALALYAEGLGSLRESLPGKPKASARKQQALRQFQRAQQAIERLEQLGAADAQSARLATEVADLAEHCARAGRPRQAAAGAGHAT